MKIAFALCLYFVATLITFYGETFFLKSYEKGQWGHVLTWVGLSMLTVPMYLIGTYILYDWKASWSWVQFPYWMMSILVSYMAFRSILHTSITWKEVISAILIAIIAIILGW